MIKRVHIRNFKSLFDVTVDLGPFTVLIGQNGAGKSSFLQALQMLSWLVRYRSINDALDAYGWTYNDLVYLRSSSSAMHWELDVTIPSPTMPDQSIGAHIEISLAKRKFVCVTRESVLPPGMGFSEASREGKFFLGRSGRKLMVAVEGAGEEEEHLSYQNVSLPHSILLDVSRQPERFRVLSRIAEELAGFVHYEIWGPELLRRASKGSATVLAERGQNLPSLLYTLRSREPESFHQLVQELRKAYEWLDSIEIRKLGEGKFALSFLEKVKDRKKRRVRYQPSQVSDGFLRLLALTSLKYQIGKTSVVGYEEPENGMHPGMLRESIARLRDVSKSGTQVIITTHSPFLLQGLLSEESGGDPENELRLVYRGKDGKTVIRPPNKKMLADARAQGIGVGELWSMLLDEREMASLPGSGKGQGG